MIQTVRDNPILFCLLLFLCTLAGARHPALTVLCISFIWIWRTKDWSVILLLSASFLILMPRWNEKCRNMKNGTAVIVNGSYSILQNHRDRIIVYTNEPLQYDAVYEIHEKPKPVSTSSNGFYGFDGKAWLKGLGVSGSVSSEKIRIKDQRLTIRASLQKRIRRISDSEYRQMLYRVLLNIRLKDINRDDWIYDNGFSYAGILLILNTVLKYFLDWKKRKKVMILCSLLLSIIYHFPLLTVQTMIFHILSLTEMDSFEKTGLGLSLIIILYPSRIKSMSFLIPAVYRICSLKAENARIISFSLVLALQSVFMNFMNPVRNICYGILQRICGLLWLDGILALFLPGHLFLFLAESTAALDTFLDHFDISGNILSVVLPFFLLFALSVRKKKHAPYLICTGMLLLQISGWFHPFGEMTFLSVGQGDSILIRAPMNSTNVLIDTGKPSAWNSVDTFLKAKGIRHLDGLIITHGDQDHAGNKDQLLQYYKPERLIENHQKETEIGPFVFYDLNEMKSEDENSSSLVDYVKLNSMQVCLMGDATADTEQEIIHHYGQLHCDVLKLGHHGSKTSSSDSFLDTVKPDLGIISSGPYSLYHHPSPETIQKLLKRHVPYFDTKEEGDITILFLPHCNLLVTSQGKVAIIPE